MKAQQQHDQSTTAGILAVVLFFVAQHKARKKRQVRKMRNYAKHDYAKWRI